DVLPTRLRLTGEQRHGGQDHAGSAVPALHGVGLEERLLNRMEAVAARQALDGPNLFACGVAHRRGAGADRLTVNQDRAGAAPAFATAVFAAGEVQVVSQDAEQCSLRVRIGRAFAAVDVEFLDGWHEVPPGEEWEGRLSDLL